MRDCEHDMISPLVKPVSPRMRNRNKVGNLLPLSHHAPPAKENYVTVYPLEIFAKCAVCLACHGMPSTLLVFDGGQLVRNRSGRLSFLVNYSTESIQLIP
jgi:hypothetical protein